MVRVAAAPKLALLVMLLAVLLAAVPLPVQADVVSRGRTLSFESVDLLAGTTQATLTAGDARGLREEADVDDDGDVNHSEGRAFEPRFRETLEAAQVDRTRVDGAAPAEVEVTGLELDGLVAPTWSNASIEASVAFRLSFPGTAADAEIVLERRVDPSDAGPWTVRAPPGYRVDRVEGLDGVVVGEADRVVEGRSDGEATIRVVVVARLPGEPGDGAVPGFGWAAVLGAAAGAAVLVARRS